jgi:hypothetical protein
MAILHKVCEQARLCGCELSCGIYFFFSCIVRVLILFLFTRIRLYLSEARLNVVPQVINIIILIAKDFWSSTSPVTSLNKLAKLYAFRGRINCRLPLCIEVALCKNSPSLASDN